MNTLKLNVKLLLSAFWKYPDLEENISHIKENGIEPASSAVPKFQTLLECRNPDHITSHKKDKLSMLFCEV